MAKSDKKSGYIAIERIRHDGATYRPGEEVELTDAQAEHLLRTKKVALPGGDVAAQALIARQAGELTGRVKDDLEAAQTARDEAAEDREAAAKDLKAAKAERAEAEKVRDEAKALAAEAKADREKAEAERKAVEEAAKKSAKK